MRGDVGDLLVEFWMKIVAARVAHEPRARAVTAIRGAAVRDQKQNAVGITMHESGHWRMRIFADGIAHLPRRSVGFGELGNDLQPDGAVFIRRINQVEKIRRDGERELGVREFRAGEFLRRERGQKFLQLLHRRDAVLELPFPVVPVGVRNIAPQTASGGMELF